MTRFLVVLIVLFMMYGTWGWVHAPERDKEFFIHSEIKSKVQKMLGEAILAQRSQAREIEFISFWTKSLSPKEIHLFFTYRFIDDLNNPDNPDNQDNPDNSDSQDNQDNSDNSDNLNSFSTSPPKTQIPKEPKEPIYQEISGKAFLYLKSQSNKKQNWLLEKITTTQDKLLFTKEIVIESKF